MTTLALDIALKTGWARRDRAGVIHSGVWFTDKPARKHEGEPLHRLEQWIVETVLAQNVNRIIVERPITKGSNSSPLQVQMSGVALLVAGRYGLTFEYASPATVKKAVTGNGHAEKEDMVRAAENYLGRKVIDDNEADAVSILLAAEAGKHIAVKKPKKRKSTKCNTKTASPVAADLFGTPAPKPRARRRKST